MPNALTTLDEARLRAILSELGEAAHAHRFEVAPNPCVGAAVVSRGEVIGRGYHEFWGGPHAEVNALAAAAASGVASELWDTLIVTLEPCSSEGKTPPCTDALRAAGIGRVVVGELDPDPRHQGRGVALLREQGIEVETVPGIVPLARVAPQFTAWLEPERLRRPRPWTVAKWAQTRSGLLQPPADVGEGRWISSLESRAEVQVLRGRVDAIVTGVTTILHDDARLTLRPPGDVTRPPVRVVLDSLLRTPPTARVLAGPTEPGEAAGESVVLGAIGASPSNYSALQAAGARVEILPARSDGRLSLAHVQDWLWDAGFRRVLLEAGPFLLSACFEERRIDQVRVYTSDLSGGRGESLSSRPSEDDVASVLHREVGGDAVMEGFVGDRSQRRR